MEDTTFLDGSHFGCQAKAEMFSTHHCEDIVKEAVPILEFSIHDSICLCVLNIHPILLIHVLKYHIIIIMIGTLRKSNTLVLSFTNK